jgi:serine phosphatase RsbU (regulator of sigma subunit)
MNAVKAQKAELEKQVKEKTADIQKANENLTERQEEILQQQEELQAQAELLQHTNDNLRNTQEEIALQRDHLRIVNEQMMSSIHYAQTIQMAILPDQEKIRQIFPEHFILYRPKDVVSGDFYWFSHLANEDTGLETDLSFVAVVDCTGHGVPVAFMSIIGSTLLNEIVNQKQVFDPAQILEQLGLGVKAAVAKAKGINTAGMDVCLCRIEKEGAMTRILFSGAKRNLLFVKAGAKKVEKLTADRRSIGSNSAIEFSTTPLLLESGSILYLTSDGYTGAIIFMDVFLFNKIGLRQNYAESSGQSFNWSVALSWGLSLLLCLALGLFFEIEIFFLGLPGWFAAVLIYVTASKLIQKKPIMPLEEGISPDKPAKTLQTS